MKLIKTKEVTEYSKMVGANLRYIRIHRGLTQTKVAEALNLTFQQMQKYEAGTNCINVWRLNQLSEFFKFSVLDILDPDLIMRMCKFKDKQDDLKYEHQDELKDQATDWIKKHPKETRELLDLEPRVIVGSLEKIKKDKDWIVANNLNSEILVGSLKEIKDELTKDGIDPEETVLPELRKAAKEKVKYDVERKVIGKGSYENH